MKYFNLQFVFYQRLMFWSDWGKSPKIERAGMNGDNSTRSIIIDKNILWPNGITIDYELNRLYWVDSKLCTISSANLDGSNRVQIIGQLKHPFAITYFLNTLFWTDWGTEAIHYCDLNSKVSDSILFNNNSISSFLCRENVIFLIN